VRLRTGTGKRRPTGLDPHRLVQRPVPVEPRQLFLQLGPPLLQPERPILRKMEQAADVLAISGPSLARDQVRLGIGEPAAGLQPDVAGPQRGPELPESAQLVVVAVDLAVPADDAGAPPRWHELYRRVRRHLALSPGVEVP
jgi:hypothetical protein